MVIMPRKLYGTAGLVRESQTVSETRTESQVRALRLRLIKWAKFGLPISSSSSQMN